MESLKYITDELTLSKIKLLVCLSHNNSTEGGIQKKNREDQTQGGKSLKLI